MEVVITLDPTSASQMAARFVARQVRNKPDSVLGLATGNTPVKLYEELIRMHRQEGLDFSRCTTFNLDEYVGLGPTHPASYRFFMQKHFFEAIGLAEDRIHIPDGLASDIPTHCAEYEQAITKAGGIDLQILGIGSDGHIGFNEPGSSLGSRTRIKTLTERTVSDNVRFFPNGDVPRHVVTMGIGTILEARTIVLLAFGHGKAHAIADMVEGPITAMVPASVLQLHPVVKVLLDEAAASELRRTAYYKRVFENKPDWQRW